MLKATMVSKVATGLSFQNFRSVTMFLLHLFGFVHLIVFEPLISNSTFTSGDMAINADSGFNGHPLTLAPAALPPP